MRKIISLLVIGVLLLSGVGAGAYFIQKQPNQKLQTKSDIILFSEPIITENEQQYLTVELKESNAALQYTGEPILPIINKKYSFPFGTIIKDIRVTFSGNTQYNLPKKIIPAPVPVTSLNEKEINGDNTKENKVVYMSQDLYPKQSYTYSLHAGLEQKKPYDHHKSPMLSDTLSTNRKPLIFSGNSIHRDIYMSRQKHLSYLPITTIW